MRVKQGDKFLNCFMHNFFAAFFLMFAPLVLLPRLSLTVGNMVDTVTQYIHFCLAYTILPKVEWAQKLYI